MEAVKEAKESENPLSQTEREAKPLPAIITLTTMQRRALNSVLDESAAIVTEMQRLQSLLNQSNKESDEIVIELESQYGLEKDALKTAYQYNRKEFFLPS